ncbi:hypothetical protein [Cupriavidus basilensis]|uniref:Uncharacterized protein n=1 Tax=Cupriavidus basilensis TaxID=68895 RepID=A0A643G2Z0_9BURK|nr:hypothetical protein [Cupriavidus basilensis]QOT81973.1 hypothetical protein F7R26_038910 [Cupriavidus basilensis]
MDTDDASAGGRGDLERGSAWLEASASQARVAASALSGRNSPTLNCWRNAPRHHFCQDLAPSAGPDCWPELPSRLPLRLDAHPFPSASYDGGPAHNSRHSGVESLSKLAA